MSTTPNPLLPTLNPATPLPVLPPVSPGMPASPMSSMAGLGAAQQNAASNPFSNIGKPKTNGGIGGYGSISNAP